jgi:ABC-type dipeptide/oligopeptide/nickel transport system permease subunit
MEMLSIEETFLMVVISTITTRDTLGILIGLVATIEGKKIDPLITLETSPVHTVQTSKKV